MKQIIEVADPYFSEEFEAGVRSVIYIRCMKHRAIPAYNRDAIDGTECAACAIQKLRMDLDSAREVLERESLSHNRMMKDPDVFGCKCPICLWVYEHPKEEE